MSLSPRRFAARVVLAAVLVMGLAGPVPAQGPSMRAADPAVQVVVPGDGAAARNAPIAIDLPVRFAVGRVVVRAEAGLESRAEAIAERADAELAGISEDLRGLPAPAVVEIRLVHDSADLARAAPPGRGAPEWAAGVAYPDVGVVVVATYRGPSSIDVDGTVSHELAHLALGAALGKLAPRWLHEGFAYLHSSDWDWQRAQTLAGMAWFGTTISLTDLEYGFPREELPASRAYAESYDFVSFLAKRGRWPEASDDGDRFPFQQFLAQIVATGDLDAAAHEAYGRSMQQLFEEWEADLEGRFLFMPIGLFLMSLWVLGAILLVLGWRRRRKLNKRRLADWDRQEQVARDAVARHAEDGGPRLVPAVPVWSGPLWAPPGSAISEPPEDDVEALLEDELDDDERPRPPRPPRTPRSPN